MRAVDTNVMVRLTTRDDKVQVAAAEKYIAERGAWMSHLVLVELAWVLESVYEFERTQIAAAIEMLLEQEHLVVQEPDIVAAAVKQYRTGIGSDFADCMILEVARGAGHLPLASFDRKLAKAEGAHRLR
ncbi:MAG TPA: type II toxin-antitoxin system VapC family toxin [Polyangiaceae bacterium]|jgi:predicted nucleic-acid-binding protein|nr:type II toxin-antitoxin system VapC family toxin [Polyangiaceae bacterium]